MVLPKSAWKLTPRYAVSRGRKRFRRPVVRESPEGEQDRTLFGEAAELAAAARHDDLLGRIRTEMASRETTPMGIRHSELTFSALYSGLYAHDKNPAAAAKAVAPFVAWYDQRGADADVAALVARAHQIVAEILQGDQPSGAPTRARRNAVTESLVAAEEIMDHAAPAGQGRELWHRARFRGALLATDDPDERSDRFERFLAFDPGNAVTYFERAGQLLPRWQGGYEQIEAFAQQSAARTRHLWGGALYTMIHMALAGRVAMDRTEADWNMILAGFEDALDFLPPVPVINDFLRLVARFGRADLARKLFSKLPELRLDRWDDADEPFEVYVWAHGRGRWPYAPRSRRAPRDLPAR